LIWSLKTKKNHLIDQKTPKGCIFPDPDPSIFIIDLQDANKKRIKKKSFSAYYFFKVLLLHHFSKVKGKKEVT